MSISDINKQQNVVICCIFCCKSTNISNKHEENVRLVKNFFRLVLQFGGTSSNSFQQVISDNAQGAESNNKFCVDCSEIVNSFCSVYHDMKLLEMQLHWKLDKLKEIIKSADKVPSRMYVLKQSYHKNVYKNVRKFRRKTVKNFSQILYRAAPRVLLHKVDRRRNSVLDQENISKQTNPPKKYNQPEQSNLEQLSNFIILWIGSLSAIVLLLSNEIPHKLANPSEISGRVNVSIFRNADDSHKLDLLELDETCDYHNIFPVDNPTGNTLNVHHCNDYDDNRISDNPDMTGDIIMSGGEHNNSNSEFEAVDTERKKQVNDKEDASFKNGSNSDETETKYLPPDKTETTVYSQHCNVIKTKKKKILTNKKPEKRFTCPICFKRFKTGHNRNTHRRLHHILPLGLSKPYICSYCNVRHTSKINLATHNSTFKHKTMKRLYLTIHWGQASSKMPSLVQHTTASSMNSTDGKNSASLIVPKQEPQTRESTISPIPSPVYNFRKRTTKLQPKKYFSDDEDDSSDKQNSLGTNSEKSSSNTDSSRISSTSSEEDISDLDEVKSKSKIDAGSRHSQKTKLLTCTKDTCMKTFYSEKSLKAHQQLHGKFACIFCPYIENYAPKLALHEYKVHSNIDPSSTNDVIPVGCYKCPRCVSVHCSEPAYVSHHTKAHLGLHMRPSRKEICSICNLPVEQIFSKIHFKTHHDTSGVEPSNILKCTEENCNAFFLQNQQMRKHIQKVHANSYQDLVSDSEYIAGDEADLSGKFRCKFCAIVLKTLRGLIIHKKIHSAERMAAGGKRSYRRRIFFICRQSGCAFAKFKTEAQLEYHKQNFHGDFLCKICKRAQPSASDLAIHETTEHTKQGETSSQKTNLFRCARCPKIFRTRKRYISHHLVDHQGLKSRPSKSLKTCSICKLSLIGAASLRDHVKTHHSTETMDQNQVQNCDHCPAYFVTPAQLKLHKIKIHQIGQKKGKKRVRNLKINFCSECNLNFISVLALCNHQKTVHGQIDKAKLNDMESDAIQEKSAKSQFQCHLCPQKFSSREKVLKHCQEAHKKPNQETNQYKCPFCQKEFKSETNLLSHMSWHKDGKDEKEMICDVCGKVFNYKHLLSRHMLTHAGRESWPYECSVCNRKFQSKFTLKVHMGTHSNEKRFVCDLCGQKYAHRHNLRHHMKNKHGQTS